MAFCQLVTMIVKKWLLNTYIFALQSNCTFFTQCPRPVHTVLNNASQCKHFFRFKAEI